METERLLVRASDLTPRGALSGKHLEAIRNLLGHDGGFAIVPSDTCYSLAAIPAGPRVSQRINLILDREKEPISLAFDGLGRVREWVKLNIWAMRLFEHLTPGPLTVVCPLRDGKAPWVEQMAKDVLAAPDRTLGVRIPDSRIESQLVESCEFPVTTVAIRTRNTKQPVTDFEQARDIVLTGLSSIENPPPIAIVEGRHAFEPGHSTVVRVFGRSYGPRYEVLRNGTITEDQLRQALDQPSHSEVDFK
jgi:L-threonylcarbamoyladenylate synthase